MNLAGAEVTKAKDILAKKALALKSKVVIRYCRMLLQMMNSFSQPEHIPSKATACGKSSAEAVAHGSSAVGVLG